MKIEIIRDMEGLKSLEAGWNDLVEGSNFDYAFSTFEWFYSFVIGFGKNKNLCVVTANENGKLLGIMPLFLGKRSVGGLKATVLTSITNLDTPRYSFLYKDDNVLKEMLRFLNSNISWDFMDLEYVPSNCEFLGTINGLSGKHFYSLLDNCQMESCYVKVTGSWEDYLKGLHKKLRRNLNYYEERLKKEGGFDVQMVSAGEDLEKHVLEAFDIEKKSWKGAKGTSILDAEGYKDFYLNLALSAGKKGWFELYFLVFKGERIAFDYCFRYKDRFNVLKTGYDPAYSKNSPGRVLKKKILQRLFEEKTIGVFDFGGSKDTWKTEWTPDSQALHKVVIFNKRTLPVFIGNYLSLKQQLKDNLRQVKPLYAFLKRIL